MKLSSLPSPILEMDRQLTSTVAISEQLIADLYWLTESDREIVSGESADALCAIVHLFNAQIEYYLPASAPKTDDEWSDLTEILVRQSEWLLREAQAFRIASEHFANRLKRLAESRLDSIPSVFTAVLSQPGNEFSTGAPSPVPALDREAA